MEEFSIRDYTNKMRTVNAYQCWPFDLAELSLDDIQSKLPPMTVSNPATTDRRSNNPQQKASRKSRFRTLSEIIDWKKETEEPLQNQAEIPLPPPEPTAAVEMVPQQPPPVINQQPSPEPHCQELLNVIVLDDVENEDSQLKGRISRRFERRSELNEIRTAVPEMNDGGDGKHDMKIVEEFTEPKGDAAKLKLQNPVINGSKRLKDTPAGNKKVNLGDSDASAQEKKGKGKLDDSVGKQQKAMSGIHISENTSSGVKIKAEPEEIHGHNQVPSSNVSASSFEKNKFSGKDEGSKNLKVNANVKNLGINMHKRKELYPKLEKKQCSNAPEQEAVHSFLKSCANQEKLMQLGKKSKSSSRASFFDDNLVRFDKGNPAKPHFSPSPEVSIAIANSRRFVDQCFSLSENEQNFNGLSLDSNGKLIKFNSSGKFERNQPEKSSQPRGSFSGLPVNNSLHQSSQQSLSIGERNVVPKKLQNQVKQELFNPIDSESKLTNDFFIEQNKEDNIPPRGSSGLISPCSSQTIMSLNGRDVQMGRSSEEKQKRGDFRVPEESRRHYSEGAAKHKAYSGSQLQISNDRLYQPVILESNKTSQNNILMRDSNSKFQQSNHRVSQNSSLGGVSRNGSSNFSEQLTARTNPQGSIFNPALNNGEMIHRKRHHHVTSSGLELSFLSPPPPASMSLSMTHERLPGPTSSNSFAQNTWSHNLITPSSSHSTEALHAPNSIRNAILCPPAPILQTAHVPVTNQLSAINRNTITATTNGNHQFSNSRKRPVEADFIDLTKPNKLPHVEEQENSRHVTGANLQGNTREVQPGPSVGARRNYRYKIEARYPNQRSHLGLDSFDMNPVLKNSHNVDQDNSNCIPSSMPIAETATATETPPETTDSDRDLELQRKLTKTYKQLNSED